MGISFMHSFRYNPSLVIGKVTCKRILCVYITYLDIIKHSGVYN